MIACFLLAAKLLITMKSCLVSAAVQKSVLETISILKLELALEIAVKYLVRISCRSSEIMRKRKIQPRE